MSDGLLISDFYKEKSVLVTGVTGFMGKLLITKLLSTCPTIKHIYCLVRERDNHTAEQRLNEIITSRVFDPLRKTAANFKDKLVPIRGNIVEAGLGLSEENVSRLKREVSAVFHLAGSAKFDDDLRTSLMANVVGLRNVMDVAREFAPLDAFVYVSSVYANCERAFIEEKVYPCKVEPQKILNILDWMSDEMLALATKKLIGEKPNTFTFTKWVAETLLENERGELPIVMVRPSTVGASWKEPFAGWVEKSSGPCDIFIAAGRGYLRSIKGEGHAVLDIVPVDIVVNLLISSAWYMGAQRKINKQQNMLIYHCTTGGLHPFRWGEMESFFDKIFEE